jgi:hypothetical protein
MWIIVGFVARITGFGNLVSLLIVLASFAGVLTGTYVLWRSSLIQANNAKWEQRMIAEKLRVEDILAQERESSATRITNMLKKQIELQEQIDEDEKIIDGDPTSTDLSLDAERVRRIDNVH